MRYTGPKNKVARRENTDLGLKTIGSKSYASMLKKINITPGQHGASKRRKLTERGKQLREKQKLRYLFLITEKQLKNYFKEVIKVKENTVKLLCQKLENRLDNVVYRLGYAPTRSSARQLVSHGHVNVNNQVVSIPSFQTKIGQVVSLASKKANAIPYIATSLEKKDHILPSWLERKANIGKIKEEASEELIAKQIDLRQVIEYYSK